MAQDKAPTVRGHDLQEEPAQETEKKPRSGMGEEDRESKMSLQRREDQGGARNGISIGIFC